MCIFTNSIGSHSIMYRDGNLKPRVETTRLFKNIPRSLAVNSSRVIHSRGMKQVQHRVSKSLRFLWFCNQVKTNVLTIKLIRRTKAQQGTHGFSVMYCVNWGHFLRHFLLCPHKNGHSHGCKLARKIWLLLHLLWWNFISFILSHLLWDSDTIIILLQNKNLTGKFYRVFLLSMVSLFPFLVCKNVASQIKYAFCINTLWWLLQFRD